MTHQAVQESVHETVPAAGVKVRIGILCEFPGAIKAFELTQPFLKKALPAAEIASLTPPKAEDQEAFFRSVESDLLVTPPLGLGMRLISDPYLHEQGSVWAHLSIRAGAQPVWVIYPGRGEMMEGIETKRLPGRLSGLSRSKHLRSEGIGGAVVPLDARSLAICGVMASRLLDTHGKTVGLVFPKDQWPETFVQWRRMISEGFRGKKDVKPEILTPDQASFLMTSGISPNTVPILIASNLFGSSLAAIGASFSGPALAPRVLITPRRVIAQLGHTFPGVKGQRDLFGPMGILTAVAAGLLTVGERVDGLRLIQIVSHACKDQINHAAEMGGLASPEGVLERLQEILVAMMLGESIDGLGMGPKTPTVVAESKRVVKQEGKILNRGEASEGEGPTGDQPDGKAAFYPEKGDFPQGL